MAISDFQNFSFLTPNNQNFDFSKMNTQKIENFTDIQKIWIYIIELSVTNMCAKFQANIFIFCGAMAQKPNNGNDVTFLISIFGISNSRTKKTHDIFGMMSRNWTRLVFFWKEILIFKI